MHFLISLEINKYKKFLTYIEKILRVFTKNTNQTILKLL